jgi:hypothetical protein
MLFCSYVTQVYEIAKTLKLIHVILYIYVYEINKNIKVNVWYSVHVPHKFMRSHKTLKLMYGILYMYHTSLCDHIKHSN